MPVVIETTKLKIACTSDDPCPMTHGDIWCIIGENGHVCRYLQLGIDNTPKEYIGMMNV